MLGSGAMVDTRRHPSPQVGRHTETNERMKVRPLPAPQKSNEYEYRIQNYF